MAENCTGVPVYMQFLLATNQGVIRRIIASRYMDVIIDYDSKMLKLLLRNYIYPEYKELNCHKGIEKCHFKQQMDVRRIYPQQSKTKKDPMHGRYQVMSG